MTASVLVEGTLGERRSARLLIDGGSQRSYIRKEQARSISAKALDTEHLNIHSFGEKSSSCTLSLVNVTLHSKSGNSFSGSFKLLSSPQLCSPLDCVPFGPWVTELQEKGFHLADKVKSSLYDKQPIDIVLGADQIWKVFMSNMFTTTSGVSAWETKFGWVLQGPVSVHNCCASNNESIAIVEKSETSALFSIDVSGFWKLEAEGSFLTDEKTYPLVEKFDSSITREEDGRYKVPLLWKNDDHNSLQSNLQQARYRLKCLENRLDKNPKLKENYGQVFKDYKQLDIIEKVSDYEIEKKENVFYLPHHAVVREQSATTKVRPVFDGSSKDANGTSFT
jgi:hypothetical protein